LNDVIGKKKVGRAFADSRPAFCSRERGRTFPRLSLQRTRNDGRMIFFSVPYPDRKGTDFMTRITENATHSIAFLPWFEEMNLGYAQTVC